MKLFLVQLIVAVIFLQSCQKAFETIEEPTGNCRLASMIWTDDSTFTSNYSFHYDAQNRLSAIALAPEGDSAIAVFAGNSRKPSKLRMFPGSGNPYEVLFAYDNSGQVTEISGLRYKANMFYKNGKLDSASFLYHPRPDWPGFGGITAYKFYHFERSSKVSVVLSNNSVRDSTVIEFTEIENKFPELTYFCADDFYPVGPMSILSQFGYVDKFLCKKETVWDFKNDHPMRPGEPRVDGSQYDYTLNPDGLVKSSELSYFFGDQIFYVSMKYRLSYDCK